MAVEQALLALIGAADVGGAYRISRSLRFNSADSAYLSRTPGSAGNQKTYTLSMWIKRSKLGAQQMVFGSYFSNLSRYQTFYFSSSDTLEFFGGVYTTGGSAASTNVYLSTTAVYRDVSAWYHIVLAVDTTQATDTNRVKLYVNGSQVTAFSTATYPAQNSESYINSVQPHYLGDWGGGSSLYFNGYIADVYLLDGTATTPSTFAETDAITGQWVPKTPTGISYGTNGFRLSFSDNSGTTSTTLGKDAAGSNNWTPNNFSVASGSGNDSLVDSPTGYGSDLGNGGEVRGNYCTLSPLQTNGGTLSNGNLDYATSTATVFYAMGTVGVASGKWYFECTRNAGNSAYPFVGVFKQGGSVGSYLGETADAWTLILDSTYNGYWRSNGTLSGSSAGTFVNGDIAMVAVDMDAGKIWFGRNGTWAASGNPASGSNAQYTNLSGTVTPAVAMYQSAGASLNAGARPFAYTAPSGFKALCTTNLPEPTLVKGSSYMDTLLYTGNGSARSITGLGFSPDFVWIKERSGADNHRLVDAVRGATKELYSSLTNAEGTDANGLTAFNSDGFSLGTSNSYNENGVTHVAWCWDAGSSTVTNTSGTISSQVRANASAGFSVVTYTGTGSNATVGHGCGAAPSMIIAKNRDISSNWSVYHSSLGKDYFLRLNTTDSQVNSTNYWGSGGVTSTVFGLDSGIFLNTNGQKVVAYCFAPVAGYSAFGSYTGGGSSGQFVYTGFRPKLVWVKNYNSSSYPSYTGWYMWDSVRGMYNYNQANLNANSSNQEGIRNTGGSISTIGVDLLSNGFCLRGPDDADTNWGGGQYIYCAWAESPFAYARAR